MAMVLLFAFGTQSAKADIKATAPFYAWDRTDEQFKNSNIDLWLDPEWWIPLIHEFNNDNDPYLNACGTSSSIWAGELILGLGHVDTTGGAGFQASRNWTIVECDRNGDGNFNNADLSVPVNEGAPLYGFREWSGINDPLTFHLISRDVETNCTTGNCATELLTTMFVNLDPDCDNIPGHATDPTYDIPPGGLCFYAEAQPSALGSLNWEGNLQARIEAGGGDKTVNFSVRGPNAVTINSFTATPQRNFTLFYIAIGAVAAILFVGLGAFNTKRKATGI